MGYTTFPTNAPGGPERDVNDHERLRHARDRHLGFPLGRHIQPAPMIFTRDGHNVFLGDMYRGSAAFLICGGPSLTSHDLTKLHERGIVTCAVNNAAVVFRPHLWVSVDDPGNFCDAIWRDPGIMKFVPLCHMEKNFTVRHENEKLAASQERVGDMPAVFGYRRNEAFQAEQWLYEDTFNWGNNSDRVDAQGCKGSRSVMLVALRLLFYLGIRRLYLLGCDFRMTYGKQNYAFEQDRSRGSVSGNNSSYEILNVRLKHLLPHFAQERYEIFNCTPNSGLTVFPFCEFEDAVKQATVTMPKKIITAGMYDRNAGGGQGKTSHAVRATASPLSQVPPRDASTDVLPDFTLVTAVDRDWAETLKWTWPTWMKFRPQLQDRPTIIIHEPGFDLDARELQFVRTCPNVRFVVWAADQEKDLRDRWAAAFLHVPAQYVETPWYLKLEPEAIACNGSKWVFGDWFQPTENGELPRFTTSPWGYSRPADAIEKLDDWGDRVEGLSRFARLELPYDASDKRVVHPTVSSWCFFANTEWTREVSEYARAYMPCKTHDTFVYYCAARRREPYYRRQMKDYGWEHSFSGRQKVPARCRELLGNEV
jgi:hypothetical protein